MEILELKNLTDSEVEGLLNKHRLALTVAEARKIETEILERPMTLAEATAWSIEGSEHCSYKSSRHHLKQLPTTGPNVIMGPEEDAGIVELVRYNGERWGIVMGHESHNHPSQIVPYEGAATGIGGMVRDVVCMGAKVIAVADPLRFGEIKSAPNGGQANKSKWIADGVTSGIGGYGNPIGVPNLAGDVYFSSGFNDNCLVNVVSLGLVKESSIIHSKAPAGAGEGNYDIILIGKPTDNSGFGGASFASLIMDESKKEKNKGAVQEPNAFLKRHLLESTYDLFKTLKDQKLLDKVGFKDLGAGGVLCCSVEITDAGGYGAEIYVEKIHTGMEGLAPEVIMCAETQERFIWVAHPEVTPIILDHYNKKWALPKIAKGAAASVIGKVTVGGRYTVKFQGEKIIDAMAQDITRGLRYDRKIQSPNNNFQISSKFQIPKDLNQVVLQILGHENVASRDCVYEKYDKSVQGLTIIEPGAADAGVMAPLIDEELPENLKKVGVALAVDCNPFYSRISPYWGAVNAVVEAMRNVAAVGAIPWAVTDCLNYGNPEKPEQMWELVEGIRGVADACKNIHLKSHPESAVPIISGNVSLYNESHNHSVDPSAVIAMLGRLADVDKAITMEFKEADSVIMLIGERKNELGGSVFYQLSNELGANVPQPNFKEAENQIFAVTDLIDNGLLLSCHDISDGGLATTLAEMCFGGDSKNRIGCEINLEKTASDNLNSIQKLFSETGGFVLETKKPAEVMEICKKFEVNPIIIGQTTHDGRWKTKDGNHEIVNLEVFEMAKVWRNGLRDKLK